MRQQTQLRIFISVILSLAAILLALPQASTWAGVLIGIAFFTAFALPLVPKVHGWWTATHVAVSPKGIRLYSLHWYGDKVSKPIPWSKIGSLRLGRQKSLIGQNEWLEVMGCGADPEIVMRLSIDGIASGDHRKRLLAAFKQHLSVEQMDLALQDILNPVKLGTHTQMWLDVLSSSPKRLVENHLSEGQPVCNGRYKIVEQLGIGGQAVAYVADQVDEQSGKICNTVVLKEFVLPAEASLKVSKKAFETIERESELLSHVSHNRIVALLDLFVDDQRAYMVLERVPGKNLRQVIAERGPFGEKDLLELALQMCDVLGHLHSLNPPVIHRDFTPDNLILNPESGIKLIDFNVAQQYEASATRTVVGKHSYIPPEQFRGKACPQSDLYALGATLYYMLTGQDPDPITVARPIRIMSMISPRLDEIVAKCTAQNLQDRYETAEEISAAINALIKRGEAESVG